MKGPGGYGRYDEDLSFVGCPWQLSDRSVCVARLGRLGLHSAGACVTCENTPAYLAEELAGYYPPARELLAGPGDEDAAADAFAVFVREMTEPGREPR